MPAVGKGLGGRKKDIYCRWFHAATLPLLPFPFSASVLLRRSKWKTWDEEKRKKGGKGEGSEGDPFPSHSDSRVLQEHYEKTGFLPAANQKVSQQKFAVLSQV